MARLIRAATSIGNFLANLPPQRHPQPIRVAGSIMGMNGLSWGNMGVNGSSLPRRRGAGHPISER
jgi:hypothetical protein